MEKSSDDTRYGNQIGSNLLERNSGVQDDYSLSLTSLPFRSEFFEVSYISDGENSSNGCTDHSVKSVDGCDLGHPDHDGLCGEMEEENFLLASSTMTAEGDDKNDLSGNQEAHSSSSCAVANAGSEATQPILVKQALSQLVGRTVYDASCQPSFPHFLNSIITLGMESESFLVTNVAPIIAQYSQWKAELPMVEPFYAVKCNPDPVIVRLLAHLGCSFDCATMGEIDLVLHGLGEQLSLSKKTGKATRNIVYANPAKMIHMIDYAIQHGVRMTVFDGEDELRKIAGRPGGEQMQLLLRLTTDDRASICRFSKKFGCPVAEAPRLLEIAKSLNLNVAGVSFHVGSGCGDAHAYTTALQHARRVFDAAEALGMRPMHIVDIGGGFPGDKGGYGGPGMPTFQDLAAAIRAGITAFSVDFPRSMDTIRFIAEPGRYFVSASTTIMTKVYSRRGGDADYQALYVDDGVYGSFNNVVYDHATPVPKKLLTVLDQVMAPSQAATNLVKEIPTAVFGPTCDGLDQMCSLETTTLPRCEVGDWIMWENQGAYTHTASFVFNGYTHLPQKTYCYF